MSKIDRFKGQRNIERSKKYKESFVEGGKICSKCKEIRALDQYNKRQGGLQANCKICMQEYNKKRWERSKINLW